MLWDTTTVPRRLYWLIAVNNDPPFVVYTVEGPVRVAKAVCLPPAVIVLRPTEFDVFDKSSAPSGRHGDAPLTFDLAYGPDVTMVSRTPRRPSPECHAIKNPDGTYSYDWDISELPSELLPTGAVTDATARRRSPIRASA